VATKAPALPDGAVDGAVDAAPVALGDVVVPPQAAKTTDNDAAKTAPLIDHLFEEWDKLFVSSSELPGRTSPPCPAFGACVKPPAGREVPGAGRRKPSISGTARHLPGSATIRA